MNPSLESTSIDSASSPVGRAFKLLRFIAEGGSTSNLSEISRQIDVNRVTVMRLLASLEAEGLITSGEEGAHRLGLSFLTLAASALGSFDLTAKARQLLPALVKQTGLSAYLVVRDGADVVYLAREMADTPLVSRIKVGSRLPAHAATPGLVLLAALPDDAIQALYRDNIDASGESPDIDALRDKLAAVRTQGCAWSFAGLEAGIDACAAVVSDRRGHAVAALSVAGPSIQLSTALDLRPNIEAALKATATALSRAIP